MWDLKGKAKSCIPCQDNKQRCEPVRAKRVVPQKRIMEEPGKKASEIDVENTLLGKFFPLEDLNQMLRE